MIDNINIFMLCISIGILLLTFKKSYINYILSIINLIIYAGVSIHNGFIMEGIINTFLFLPLYIRGIVTWKRNSSKGITKVEKLNLFEWILYIILILVMSYTLRYFFRLTWIGTGYIQPILISLSLVGEIIKIERAYQHWYIKGIELCLKVYLLLVSSITGEINYLELIMLILVLYISFYGAYSWNLSYYNGGPYN